MLHGRYDRSVPCATFPVSLIQSKLHPYFETQDEHAAARGAAVVRLDAKMLVHVLTPPASGNKWCFRVKIVCRLWLCCTPRS